MNFKKIINYAQKPSIYEKGTAVMWTDEHISKQLLQVHLNTEVDLASRKYKTIETTCDWILDQVSGEKLNVLDLGCGPGLYAELLANAGHKVTGVDFSENSIEYAKNEAKTKGLDINYIQANYLELDLPADSFDLIILIFTDMGVLLPTEREKMIRFVYKILKPGGTFIFDVLNTKDMGKKLAPKNWEVAVQGFWRSEPYLALSESFLYEKEQVILYQHVLMEQNGKIEIYRFWTHFFTHKNLGKLLEVNGFSDYEFFENVLVEGDLWSGENVTFTVVSK